MNYPNEEQEVRDHYVLSLGEPANTYSFDGLTHSALNNIRILEFPAVSDDHDWVYATLGMCTHSTPSGEHHTSNPKACDTYAAWNS